MGREAAVSGDFSFKIQVVAGGGVINGGRTTRGAVPGWHRGASQTSSASFARPSRRPPSRRPPFIKCGPPSVPATDGRIRPPSSWDDHTFQSVIVIPGSGRVSRLRRPLAVRVHPGLSATRVGRCPRRLMSHRCPRTDGLLREPKIPRSGKGGRLNSPLRHASRRSFRGRSATADDDHTFQSVIRARVPPQTAASARRRLGTITLSKV